MNLVPGVTPSWITIIDRMIELRLQGLHTSMPAEVLKVHEGRHKRQFVDVTPTLKRRVEDENGKSIVEVYPVVPMVPVGYVQGGGFFVSVPLAVGDHVLLVFCERSIDQWIEIAKKGTRRQIDPGDIGMHVLEGAVALPVGPSSRPGLLQDVHAENLVIGLDGGVQIHVTPEGEIRLGGADVSDFVALASRVLEELQAIRAKFNAHTHVVSGSAAAVVIPGQQVTDPGSVAATKVRAE